MITRLGMMTALLRSRSSPDERRTGGLNPGRMLTKVRSGPHSSGQPIALVDLNAVAGVGNQIARPVRLHLQEGPVAL